MSATARCDRHYGVPVDIVFETHSLTEDNEAGRAIGWLGGRLSVGGRRLAAELGARHQSGLAATFCSDLARARETVEIAFPEPAVPVLFDWRRANAISES